MKTYFSLKKILNPSSANSSGTTDAPAALTPRELLLSDIEKTQHALEIAYSGFDNVTDPDLIDATPLIPMMILRTMRFPPFRLCHITSLCIIIDKTLAYVCPSVSKTGIDILNIVHKRL